MTKSYEKLVRGGKVAVLYSPGFGAGWSTWASGECDGPLFDKDLVELVLADKRDECATLAEDQYDIYTGGAHNLEVAWLPVGTAFQVNEYEGHESIETRDNTEWIFA